MIVITKTSFIFMGVLLWFGAFGQKIPTGIDVVVLGGGAGGAAAAIQSARTGAKTLLIESTPWLGGMLTAAGVGCTDGNHKLPSGIWGELREAAFKHYRTRNLATGWVSNFNIEPHVGDSIFKALAAAEKNLTIWYKSNLRQVKTAPIKAGDSKRKILSIDVVLPNRKVRTVTAKVFIDATDLGDLLAAAGGKFDLGLDADAKSGDNLGILKALPVVQDLTYAAVLKDFGKGSDYSIEMPKRYNPAEFDCACNTVCSNSKKLYSNVDAQKMLDYGKMPNGKYMINWPSHGNDFYTNLVERSPVQRAKALDSAKQKTLRFVYFIQTALGFKHLGLAIDEFSTPDKLPYIAYHREGRRAVGLARFGISQIKNPFEHVEMPLYRTGVAVGDYPIDHHHREYGAELSELPFPAVPSYSVPAGSLVSATVANLVVCDKVISVTSGANGTTRLQPVAILTGQAAGVIAALAAKRRGFPAQLSVRTIQAELLSRGVYLMPYIDVTPSDPNWAAIQRIGATGLIKGVGKPNAWTNQTWFYPDSALNMQQFAVGLQQLGYTSQGVNWGERVSEDEFIDFLRVLLNNQPSLGIKESKPSERFSPITRGRAAVLVDEILRPFELPIDWSGNRVITQ